MKPLPPHRLRRNKSRFIASSLVLSLFSATALKANSPDYLVDKQNYLYDGGSGIQQNAKKNTIIKNEQLSKSDIVKANSNQYTAIESTPQQPVDQSLNKPSSHVKTTGKGTLDSYFFDDNGLFKETDDEKYGVSVSVETETKYKSADGDTTIVFKPFYRWDKDHKDRNHGDIRQLDISVKNDSGWELKAGIGKEFWGVTESQHLIDVINQVDALEGVEEEAKLGQPMVKLSHRSGNGTFDAFILPYFREREFNNTKGYLRSPAIVDTSKTTFESEDGKKHIDYALRWSESIGKLDAGVYFFSGTDRKPSLKAIGEKNGVPVFAPHYKQTEQVGVDLQYTADETLWKLEALFREYTAAVVGLEHNLPVTDSGVEVSLLAEYHHDSRGKGIEARLQNDIYLGTRVAFNDVAGTEVLAGAFVDIDDTEKRSFRVEAGRRLGETTKVNLKAQVSNDSIENDPFRIDDYLEIGLTKSLF